MVTQTEHGDVTAPGCIADTVTMHPSTADRIELRSDNSVGVAPEILAHVYGSLEETPIAQRALGSDEVIVVSELAGHVPDRYAEVPTVTGISCTPVAAAGRWLGVIFAERNGQPLDLDAAERRTMHALGRTAFVNVDVRGRCGNDRTPARNHRLQADNVRTGAVEHRESFDTFAEV